MKFKWNKSRYWFHLSSKDLGHEVLFQPVENEHNRDYREPKGKRICVAPSIAHCLIAISCTSFFPLYIYRTKIPMKAKQASKRVWDASVTKEGWFLEPTLFEKVGVFCMGDFRMDLYEDKVNLSVCAENDKRMSRGTLSYLKKLDLGKYIRKPICFDTNRTSVIVPT